MSKLNKFIYFTVIFSFFVYLNYFLSNLISYKLIHGWKFSGFLLNIIYAENTGAAFSIMQNSTKFLIVLSLIAFFAILYYLIKNLDIVSAKGIFFLSILTSGIVGNLIERLVFGYVRDFFELNFINFPIFNISDIFINIGVLGIIILILLTKKSIKIL